MSRRAQEADFGADGFLDVLANMVGILIILIVIAGVRIARGPEDLEPSPAPSIEPAPPSIAEAAVADPVRRDSEPEPDEPPREHQEELRRLEAEMAALRARQTEQASELKDVRKTYAAAKKEAASGEENVALRQKERDAEQAEVARLQQSLGDRKQALSALLAEFEEARNARPPVTQVKHRLAPISQEVQGEEIHFRLEKDRVSVIPWSVLVGRMMAQIERQKDWLARHPGQMGTVGPIDGFSLQYTLDHVPLSSSETRRLGVGGYRLQLSMAMFTPEADLPTENADQALRRGSRFATALQAAPENATLTFWVYPDSFALYRKLQEAAYAEGFSVAARPLPEGMPIGASPNGSRSAGQ